MILRPRVHPAVVGYVEYKPSFKGSLRDPACDLQYVSGILLLVAAPGHAGAYGACVVGNNSSTSSKTLLAIAAMRSLWTSVALRPSRPRAVLGLARIGTNKHRFVATSAAIAHQTP